MIADIYRQTYGEPKRVEIAVTPETEYAQIPCDGGCTAGTFYITDEDYVTCVDCRGTGRIWINAY